MRKPYRAVPVVALWLLSAAAPAAAASLSGDWNTTSATNPGLGEWQYGSAVNGNTGHMNSFVGYNTYGPGFLPRSWFYANPGPGGSPQAALVLATDGFADVPVDAVVGHDHHDGSGDRWSLYSYRIPAPGLYDITGEVWAPDNGPHGARTHDWNLNIDDGLTGNPIMTLDSANLGGVFGHNTYATRYTFSFQQLFAGGELVVMNHRHNPADGNSFGGFVAMNLVVTPVPEPSSIALLFAGTVAYVGACLARTRRPTD